MSTDDETLQREADRVLAVAVRADKIVEELYGPAPRIGITMVQSNACWAQAEAEVSARSVEGRHCNDQQTT